VSYFTAEQVDYWIKELRNGKIKPDHLVESEFSKLSLLQAVLNSELSHDSKLNRIKSMIELGCDVDSYSASMTPISMAAQGVANGPNNIDIVKYMLKSHLKGHRSDLDIMKAASGSLDKLMFRNVIRSGKIDSNVTQMRGSHILHHLADVNDFDKHIEDLFKYIPETNPNPIHRNGYSPLTLALNNGNERCAFQLSLNGGKIIGKLEDPELVVELGMVDTYEGNFFDDFPEMIDFAANNGHEDQLPKTITDLFLF